jgi:hypothetical protein
VTALGDNVQNVGGLVGGEAGTIAGSYATGTVTAGLNAVGTGGLVGTLSGNSITNSYATGNVTSGKSSLYTGGLVGDSDGISISQSHASGTVTGNSYVGGFAGYDDISISDSYASGPVTIVGNGTGQGPQYVGGFVGFIVSTTLTDSYETGSVSISGTFTSAVTTVGGFAGEESANVTNTYSSGNVSVPAGSNTIGGYSGFISGTTVNSFSTGTVHAPQPGASDIGGFVGNNNYAVLTNDSWYLNSGGDGTDAEGTDQGFGLPNIPLLATLGYGTDEATSSNFYNVTEPVYDLGSGWDFNSVWVPHANTYPTLGVSSTTFTITASAGTGGSITPTGSTTVARNTSQAFTITPSSGYSLGTISVDGSSISATSTYTFTHVYTPHSISATFTLNPVTTPPPSSGGGAIGSAGSVQYQVSFLLKNGNTPAATTLEQQFPNLFPQQSVGTSSTTPTTLFTRSLTLGSSGADVKALQEYLNTHGFTVATTGPGSAGNETTYFGRATRIALAKFQKAKGISPAVGYFGVLTRAYVISHL